MIELFVALAGLLYLVFIGYMLFVYVELLEWICDEDFSNDKD